MQNYTGTNSFNQQTTSTGQQNIITAPSFTTNPPVIIKTENTTEEIINISELPNASTQNLSQQNLLQNLSQQQQNTLQQNSFQNLSHKHNTTSNNNRED